MELKDLLDNPDYVNANTATKKAIFEKYSKNSPDYVSANDETRQVIHQRFGLAGVNVTQPLPEKFSDFTASDAGNFVRQSFSEANKQLAKGGRTPVVGPAVIGAVGETIKGLGAIGELATDKAQGITKVGQALTQGAQEANAPAAMVGQVGSYIAPYKLAQKGIQATAGRVPYLSGAVNPNTFLGSTGELAAAGALVGGLTTPGSYDERMNEAQLQALMGGGANAAIRGAMAVPGAVRQIRTGAAEGLNPTYRPGPNTAFAEVGENFYPNKTVEPFMKLTPEQQVRALPALEASQQPSSSLFTGFLNKSAQRLAPEGPKGGTLVPLEGKGLQAFTEQTTRDFFNKPSVNNLGGITGNIGGAIVGGLTGGPVGALAGAFAPQYVRALEILAQRRLQNVAGLKPGFEQQIGQAQQTAGRLGMEASIPKTPPMLGYTPQNAGKPTMYVGPTGETTTNLAGTQVNMNPGSFGQTPVAQAAQATTQRIASTAPRTTTPRTPRPPAAPKPQPQPFALPDAGTHYNTAAQGSDNFADTFNKAVTARTQDLLRDAKQTGQKLTPQQAADKADDEIRAWRRENVDAFKSKPQPTIPTTTADDALAQFTPPKVDPELASDQRIWRVLQEKVKEGKELVQNEKTAVKRITNKYGQDPFQTGNIKGETIVETPKRKNVKQETRVKEMEAERTKGMTPEQIAADEQAMLDRVKRMANPNSPFNKALKGSGGRGTMGMMTDDAGKQFTSKADFEEQQLIDRLAGKITTGSFVDNGMRYEITAIDYGTTPRKVLEGLNKPLTQVRVFSDRTNKQVSGPALEVPEKPLRQRIEERRKGK